jgi:protein O-GlcNAc transferase
MSWTKRQVRDRGVAGISIGWSSCNSILESLVHNIPIVTLAGEMMRGRHTTAIMELMDVRETTARTVEEYVFIAGVLGRDAAKRIELSVRIANRKHRVYRDRECIVALEAFLESAVRNRVRSSPFSISRPRL